MFHKHWMIEIATEKVFVVSKIVSQKNTLSKIFLSSVLKINLTARGQINLGIGDVLDGQGGATMMVLGGSILWIQKQSDGAD